MENISRRTAIKTALVGGAALAVSGLEAANPAKKKKAETKEPLNGNVRHSVSKWCFHHVNTVIALVRTKDIMVYARGTNHEEDNITNIVGSDLI